jgi:exopolysaccharide biosynthesis polyprenyl glycosylphosphotransferase
LLAPLLLAPRTINLRIQGPERVFAVAPIEDVRILERKLRNHPEYGIALVGANAGGAPQSSSALPLAAAIDDLRSLIASGTIDHLLVRADSEYLPYDDVAELKHLCHCAGIRFGAFLADKNLLLVGAEFNQIEGMRILSYDPPTLSRTSRMMKRGMDIAASAFLLVATAPLMALIALAIKLDSRGPVLFRQVRVGHEGRPFRLAKFRTMVVDADHMTEELMAKSADPNWLHIEDDPRVTRLGLLLRRSSLDELPQLWNVLRGEMSMVGPRPLSESDDAYVEGWERHRLDLVPGITGDWQISGRVSIPFREMIEIDYAYVANWSLWRDLKVLVLTVPAVVSRRGVN